MVFGNIRINHKSAVSVELICGSVIFSESQEMIIKKEKGIKKLP